MVGQIESGEKARGKQRMEERQREGLGEWGKKNGRGAVGDNKNHK